MKKSLTKTPDMFNFREVEEQVYGKSKNEITEKRHALEVSVKEGSSTSFADGIGTSFITPFALAIKSNSFQIGLLNALATILPSLGQIYGSKKMENESRKTLFKKFLLIEIFIWLPIILTAYIFHIGKGGYWLPYLFIIIYSVLITTAGVREIAWFSWMGDIVPEKLRGDYFGKRNRIITTVSLSSFLLGAFILDMFETKGLIMFGFMTLFALTMSTKIFSYHLIKKQFSPKVKIRKKDEISFIEFIRRKDNYTTYSIYRSVFTFTFMLANPFFTVYMLQVLKFDYLTYTAVTLSSSVFFIMFAPLIGKFGDKYGNIKIITFANILAAISPLIWIFAKNPWTLVFTVQLLTGIKLASLTTGTTNFTYDSLKPKERGIIGSYIGLMIGVGSFLGALAGGAILEYLEFDVTNTFFFLFGLAAISRTIVGLIFIPKIKEPSPKRRLPPLDLNLANPHKAMIHNLNFMKAIFK